MSTRKLREADYLVICRQAPNLTQEQRAELERVAKEWGDQARAEGYELYERHLERQRQAPPSDDPT